MFGITVEVLSGLSCHSLQCVPISWPLEVSPFFPLLLHSFLLLLASFMATAQAIQLQAATRPVFFLMELVRSLMSNIETELIVQVTLDAKWQAAYEKAKLMVAGMTNEEKISVITGSSVSSANWTALQAKDGDQGIEGYYYASGFSETSALVQTWDKKIIYTQMKAVGDEL